MINSLVFILCGNIEVSVLFYFFKTDQKFNHYELFEIFSHDQNILTSLFVRCISLLGFEKVNRLELYITN